MRLVVFCDGSLVATIPQRIPEHFMENFIREKAQWILGKLLKFKNSEHVGSRILSKSGNREYLKNKSRALALAQERIGYFNKSYGYNFSKISIRNQKTRWGSCSMKGNLNFNWKIILLSESQRDYIIVHELCHLGEFNHSEKFWSLVGRTIPDYRELRKELKSL